MLQLLNVPRTGQYVQLVTGLYCSCLSDGIQDIQVLSSMDVNETQVHGIRQIEHTKLAGFGSNRK